MTEFADRLHAGSRLADALTGQLDRSESDCLVVGLPRGGVPVAAVIAQQLNLPLDILLVRKLGTPGNPELAMGAIADGEAVVRNEYLIRQLGVTPEEFERVRKSERAELERRSLAYRGDRPAPTLNDRPVLVVDDGLATGATMKVAVQAARARGATKVTIAVPVGAPDAVAELEQLADQVVCLHAPQQLTSIGQWYRDFRQVTDDEVRELLGMHP